MWRIIVITVLGWAAASQAEIVRVATWNMEWFPGKNPTSSLSDRVIHMSEAKEALLDLDPDILCVQEIRDWQSFEELASILPRLQPLVVSRFRQMGNNGPITIQQTGVAAKQAGSMAWSEAFKPEGSRPPRGFSFAAVPFGRSILLIYSIHLKSNRGGLEENFGKREEAARQIISHVKDMERAYSSSSSVVTVIAGDFNTDPTDPRFASERTAEILEGEFQWAWKGIPLADRITLPASGRYPDASFDGFFVRGGEILSCEPANASGGGDHLPVMLTLKIP